MQTTFPAILKVFTWKSEINNQYNVFCHRTQQSNEPLNDHYILAHLSVMEEITAAVKNVY